jgi:regulator of CtrA degradation
MAIVQFSGDSDNTVSFAKKLAESPRFKTLFRDGMDLVEEVATYLDGQGREDAKNLHRSVALAYAAESMRLTTRLMQIASWLLVQRAVNEGEMTQDQAAAEKHKVRLSAQDVASGPDLFEKLPEPLRTLTLRSLRLQDRIIYLDRSIQAPDDRMAAPVAAASELGRQWETIRRAFRGRR